MKNILLAVLCILFFSSAVHADCTTGFACSIKDLEKQEQIQRNDKSENNKYKNKEITPIKDKKTLKNKDYKSAFLFKNSI